MNPFDRQTANAGRALLNARSSLYHALAMMEYRAALSIKDPAQTCLPEIARMHLNNAAQMVNAALRAHLKACEFITAIRLRNRKTR